MHQPQQHQQDRCDEADLLVCRQHADQKGWNRHDHDRDGQRQLSAELVADMAKDQAAQWAHQKTRGEHAEGGDQRRGGVFRREEIPANNSGKIAVDGEIIPFHDIAGDPGDDGPSPPRRTHFIHITDRSHGVRRMSFGQVQPISIHRCSAVDDCNPKRTESNRLAVMIRLQAGDYDRTSLA